MVIKILDKNTQEKIAAGEVIERPQSVVKELIDNSIDAGALKIEIEIRGMGLDLIKVTDNGSGLTADDLKIATFRHATSKITDILDLEKIKTMGFRGEALATVAATSKLEIISKTKDEPIGKKLLSYPDREIEIEDCGSPDGTQVIVKNLFFNMPARKKFMKSNTTEISHIYRIIENLAMAFPNIQFILKVDNKEKINLPRVKSIKDRFIDIFGSDLIKNTIPVNFENSFIRLFGYVSNSSYREAKRKQYLFLNKRPIISKVIYAAINEAYKGFSSKPGYPVMFLFIEMNGNLFDVNVHPQKTEVKFLNESGIFTLSRNVLYETLKNSLSSDFGINLKFKNKELLKQTVQSKNTQYNKPYNKELEKFKTQISEKQTLYSKEFFNKYVNRSEEPKKTNEVIKEEKKEEVSLVKDIELNPIAWMPDTYIIAYNKDKDLVLIDQHAAHERILFEKYLNEFKNNSIKIQDILIPDSFEIESQDFIIIQDNIENFKKLGFYIEEFGKNTFRINAVPVFLKDISEKRIILSMLERIKGYKDKKFDLSKEFLEDIIKSACVSSYRANTRLNLEEMKQIILDLLKCTHPYNCPHGRPTIIKYSKGDIEKKFGRK